jgi:FKBP-type peptidyl-prolyl cis-trans isomerase (trigger factor)
MQLPSGLEILEDREGCGPVAKIGDTVTYNVRIFLNRGDEVPMNEAQSKQGIPPDRLREEENQILVDHMTTLGKRQAMAGIEKALVGMRAGGFRKVRVSPHLAYGSRGIPGLIPSDAVLTVHVWMRKVKAPSNAVEQTR